MRAATPVLNYKAGELLQAQSGIPFVENATRGGLDLALAVLGAPISGTGELLQVTVEGDFEPKLDARGVDNREIAVAQASAAGNLPTAVALRGNYPNPFNPSTTIMFDLPAASVVKMTVYGLDGRVVKTLVDETLPAGSHTATWLGRDETGQPVSSGLYLYRLVVDGRTLVGKMTMMK